MQHDHFSRLLRLAQRTGDRLIVTDLQGHEPIVILPLDEYEGLIDSAFGPVEEFTVEQCDFSPYPHSQREEEVDEADFDPDELERSALRDLWQEPEESAPLEVIQRPEQENEPARAEGPEVAPVVQVEPEAARPRPVRPMMPVMRPANVPRANGGEEQFYLEPI